MSIVAKHVFKNIFAKPLRTFLLLTCILSCAFVAIISLDMTGNIELLVKNMLVQIAGTSDILVYDNVGITEDYQIDIPARQLKIKMQNAAIINRHEDMYHYFSRSSYGIYNMDYELAAQMRVMGDNLKLADNEAAITESLQKLSGWEVGDSITLYDKGGNEFHYKITKVCAKVGHANSSTGVYLSEEGFQKLYPNGKYIVTYIDVEDDAKAKEYETQLKKIAYNANVELLVDSEDNKELIQELAMVFFAIFAICFLLVIFVAISVSERIITERMATVGTFRSLGFSARFTTWMLLSENMLYGLIGGAIGVSIYTLVRQAIYNSIFSISSASDFSVEVAVPAIGIWKIVIILFMSMFIMCACTMKAILAASKMAIRDIIFDNKDTAYKYKKPVFITGIIIFVFGMIAFFLKKQMVIQIISFITLVIALAVVFPWILKGCSNLLAKLFQRKNMPVAQLAALECGLRKSTIGSATLCVTASTLAIIIFVLDATADNIYDVHTYDCDVRAVVENDENPAKFSYIHRLDGVTEVEMVNHYSTEILINDKKKSATIIGLNEGGFQLFSALEDYPLELDNNSICMDKSMARRLDLEIGDEIEMTFDSYTYLPVKKTLTLTAVMDAYNYDTTGEVVLISDDLYQDMYHGYIGEFLVRSDNPEETVRQIKKYSGSLLENVQTIEEYTAEWIEKEQGMVGITYMIIIIGVGLTVVGMISNQLIGFEGRKRECAVLASTAMSREKLSLMLFLESTISSGIALICALPYAFLAMMPLNQAMTSVAGSFEMEYKPGLYILFLFILWIVFSLVALFPIHSLKKMNIAMQLKYE